MKMKVLLLGHNGFVGKNVFDLLNGYFNSLTESSIDIFTLPYKSRINNGIIKESNYASVYFKAADIVINLAANVGGIQYNINNPSELFKDNINIGMNVIDCCAINNVDYLINAGTICSYPEIPPNMPIRESDFWNGYPEKSNAPYGIAKKAVIEYGKAVSKETNLKIINLMFTNMYGPYDCFDDNKSHVIPALIKRIFNADRKCTVWGSGEATRDFLYVDEKAAESIYSYFYEDVPCLILLIPRLSVNMKEMSIMSIRRWDLF